MTVQIEFKCDACGQKKEVEGIDHYPDGWLFFSCVDELGRSTNLCYCSEKCAHKHISEFDIWHSTTPIGCEEDGLRCRRDTVFENCSDIEYTATQYRQAYYYYICDYCGKETEHVTVRSQSKLPEGWEHIPDTNEAYAGGSGGAPPLLTVCPDCFREHKS